MKTFKNILFWLFILAVSGIGLAGYYALHQLPISPLPFDFELKQGSSLKSAARQMQHAGVIKHDWMFVLLARSLGKAKHIKPGNYQLDTPLNPLQLLNIISQGRIEQTEITIIEGTTFKQLRAALNANSSLRHDSLKLSEAEILRRIGASEQFAEGLFFPDTYNLGTGSSDLAVLKRAYQLMQRNLQESWKNRDVKLPLATPYQALILASIVEKETGKAGDRPMIASVFINRLKINMPLQTDPTVIYGLGDRFDGNLRKIDLLTDSSHNTYTRPGLPPTPIAFPGLAALQATLHPANSKALYFVAKGDGSSHFSSNLNEHINAVNKYQK